MPHIWVTTNTRDKLRTLKITGNFKSYDELISLSADILDLIILVKLKVKDISELYGFIDSIIREEEKRKVKGL